MNIKIKNYIIKDERIPKELSGYRMALFSDSHDAYYGPNCEDLLSKLDIIKPNIVLFAGDGNNTTHSNGDPGSGHDNFEGLFSLIASRYDIYYVAGNHEHRWKNLCDELGRDDFYDYINRLKKHGVKYLDNTSALIEDGKINIIGLNLPIEYYKYEHEALTVENIQNFVGFPQTGAYNILLTHTPKFFERYVEWGSDLTLCGHLHGGMIRLPIVGGVLSPYRQFFPKYDYGYFEKGNSKMIISSGSGDHNIRFKLLNPYEIVSIVLEK